MRCAAPRSPKYYYLLPSSRRRAGNEVEGRFRKHRQLPDTCERLTEVLFSPPFSSPSKEKKKTKQKTRTPQEIPEVFLPQPPALSLHFTPGPSVFRRLTKLGSNQHCPARPCRDPPHRHRGPTAGRCRSPPRRTAAAGGRPPPRQG